MVFPVQKPVGHNATRPNQPTSQPLHSSCICHHTTPLTLPQRYPELTGFGRVHERVDRIGAVKKHFIHRWVELGSNTLLHFRDMSSILRVLEPVFHTFDFIHELVGECFVKLDRNG